MSTPLLMGGFSVAGVEAGAAGGSVGVVGVIGSLGGSSADTLE